MGTSYMARKCTQCAGRLEFVPEKKVWRCIYCGAEIERQEKYDGPFSVRNVALQALAATAFRRFDQAFQNLAECEKIEGEYAGCLVAKVAYSMLAMITKGQSDKGAAANYMEQLRKSYGNLKKLAETDSESEMLFYDAIDEADSSSDIFATLVVVYDSLNDVERRDVMLRHLKVEGVMSKDANNSLLLFALNKKDYGMTGKILSNSKALDCGKALLEVLRKMDDGEAKRTALASICKCGKLPKELKEQLEKYAASTQDSGETVISLASSLQSADLTLDLNVVLSKGGSASSLEQVRQLVLAYCHRKMRDDEIGVLVEFAFGHGIPDMPSMVLETLANNGQYVYLRPAQLALLLGNGHLNAQTKAKVLGMAQKYSIEPRGMERLLSSYLCNLNSSAQERAVILPILFNAVEQVPPDTIKRYVLLNGVSGDEKPQMVRHLFEGDVNMSLFSTLLSQYMVESLDASTVKNQIMQILLGKGLSVSREGVMLQLTRQDATAEEQRTVVQSMLDNGVRLPGEAASVYLEHTTAARFSLELLLLVQQPTSVYSANAISNYLLRIPGDSSKGGQVASMLQHSLQPPAGIRCKIEHLQNRLDCSLFQAYVLNCPDSQNCAMIIADLLAGTDGMRLSAPMTVNGETQKFKAYITQHKEELNEISLALCEKHKVFSFFFNF